MAAIGNYYFNGTSFAQATAIYTNAGLTTLAPDGYYSNSGIVRRQLNGILLNAQTCNTCATPCGSGVSAQNSNTNGIFVASVDLANSTGASVFYGYFGTTVPDGVRLTYNSVTLNRFTCNGNHNTVVLTDGAGTTVDYAGIGNASGEYTYMGRTNANLISQSPYNNPPPHASCQAGDQPQNYVLTGGSYVAQGTYQTITVSNAMVGTTASVTDAVYTAVFPKTTLTPTVLTVDVSAPMCGTFFTWTVLCPTALPSFQGSALQATTGCAANAATYYFARNGSLSGSTITPDVNTTPEIGNFVFTNSNGSTYLNDTSVLQYVIVDNTNAVGIRNGVVVSIQSCT